MLKRLYDFLRHNGQVLYSLLLIILIPAALAANTLWLIHSINRDTNFQLRREAVLVGSVISAVSEDKLASPSALTKQLSAIRAQTEEIYAVQIFTPDKNQYGKLTSLASTDNEAPSKIEQDLGQLALTNNTSYASIIFDKAHNENVWTVMMPLTLHSSQTPVALTNVKISKQAVDAVISRTVRDSLIVLVVTIIIILLLLINHFRFFEYARLFSRLQEVDRMKDDFISMASHELKTPLTAIGGFAALLVKNISVVDIEKSRGYANHIVEATKRLTDLVEDLLNVSRLEQGRLAFDLKPVMLATVIAGIVSELKVQADQKQLALTFIPLENQLQIVADEARLKQVFVNIIGNAIKYTPQGSVTISQTLEGKTLKTFIKDTGIGMSPEARTRLFEKFYRIRSDKTQDIPGTGLGLWITKQIIEKMKGIIFVDSIEGTGSQFTVEFPVAS